MELQADFARALLGKDGAFPPALTRSAPGSSVRRFGVYRNNVFVGLIGTLAARFPITAKLVGDEFFRAMARLYVQAEPPASAVLLRYGAGFAGFIADFPPAGSLPYLADIARLEWTWHAAYHAADAAPLARAALEEAAGDALAEARFRLHPSLGILRSAYPIVTIWELAARDGDGEPVRLPSCGEDALIIRPALEVDVRRLPLGGAVFVEKLVAGSTLNEAAVSALEKVADFELAANLAGLMESGAIIGLDLKS